MKKYKIETYLPKESLEKIKDALYKIRVGKIGNYDCCMNWYEVNSSWRPAEGANPYQGKIGEIEIAAEYKLEFVCDETDLKKTIKTIKQNHPYEEVCINIFEIYQIDC